MLQFRIFHTEKLSVTVTSIRKKQKDYLHKTRSEIHKIGTMNKSFFSFSISYACIGSVSFHFQRYLRHPCIISIYCQKTDKRVIRTRRTFVREIASLLKLHWKIIHRRRAGLVITFSVYTRSIIILIKSSRYIVWHTREINSSQTPGVPSLL